MELRSFENFTEPTLLEEKVFCVQKYEIFPIIAPAITEIV